MVLVPFIIWVCLLWLHSFCLATSRNAAWSPSNPPETWTVAPWGPAPVTAPSRKHHRSFASPPLSNHHQLPHAVSPTLSIPPQDKDCEGDPCDEPLIQTPIGSPCDCVYPIQVVIDIGIDPYVLFNLVQELEIDVASGTLLKQSQVKIVDAHASSHGGRTIVSIDLVPLEEKFDQYTARLIFDRFWQKKVPIDKATFHDYEVIYVYYPGLPSSPPPSSRGSSSLSPDGESHQYPLTANLPTGKAHKMSARIIAVLVLTLFLIVFLCVAMTFLVLKSTKHGQPSISPGPTLSTVARISEGKYIIPSSMETRTPMSLLSPMVSYPISVKTFVLSQLEKATDGFSSRKLLGEGGSSRVYHGTMEDGSEVAVKLLKRSDQDRDREREFIAEVDMLSRLHHRNLVKLIGICIEGNRHCLVYELIRNGSVESHLHGTDKSKPLDWDTRMKIALGSARALAYLHEDSNPRVIHRDFKASNVLLEEDYTAKISDFGLAKEASEGSNHLSTRVMGTFGYVAPEYAMTGHLLLKSDVYSYGVMLLELLSGRKPVYLTDLQGPENLVFWARPLLGRKEGLEQLLDPSLKGKCDINNVARVAAIALICVHPEHSQRPFMGEVVQALKLICSSKEEACEDSYSKDGSSSFGPQHEFRSWWSAASPRLDFGPYGNFSPFMNMDRGSASIEEMQRRHSVSGLVGRPESLARCDGYGPLRTKRQRQAFYRLRGSVSEHGKPSRHSII